MYYKLLILISILVICSCGKREKVIEKYGNGKIRSVHEVVNNVPDGKMTLYYMNGQVEYEGEMTSGRNSGIHKQYYESGKIRAILEFNNSGGLRNCNYWGEDGKHMVIDGNGTYINYYPDGTKETQITYRNSKLVDTSFTWYRNGNIRKEVYYKNGRLIGEPKRWKRDGSEY